jgi:hypothetical protein
MNSKINYLNTALIKVEEILNLIHNNEYEQFFTKQLLPIKYELIRQISNCCNSNTQSE